jgi:carbon starvation protein
VGEHTLFGRTGGAATLAVGMAQIFSKVVSGRWLDLWYHFAIMFEALFILTTIDAGTRVARYILQDFLGHLWKPLGDTRNLGGNLVASGLMVCGWGYFLVQGVRDPLGGINSLWPLFGIANQMLAAIALCLATTLILKMELGRRGQSTPELPAAERRSGRPWLALVSFVPLVWLVSVTFTAGVQKIGHSDPRIGFLAQAAQLAERVPALDSAARAAEASRQPEAVAQARKALLSNRTLRFNNLLDAVVAGVFLALVSVILALSAREWILLLRRRKPPVLCETTPTWLPDYAVAEGGRTLGGAAGTAALVLALTKELSGEAAWERAQQAPPACSCPDQGDRSFGRGDGSGARSKGRLYAAETERRYRTPNRCC